MRILFISPYLGAAYGGTSKVVTELATSIGRPGSQIDVATTNANDLETLDIQTDCWISESSYRVRYFNTWNRSDLIISPSFTKWLTKHIKTYDLIHTHTLFSPLISFANGLCQFYKIPYIMTPHGMLDPWALAYKAWKKRIYYTCFEKRLLENASAIHVLSASEQAQVTKLGFKRTALIANGVHQRDFEKLPDPDLFYKHFPHLKNKKLILFLGRIDPKKGLDLLALAFAHVHKSHPNTHLVIAGPDSINFTLTVQRYFAEVNCLDFVTFTGMLSGPLKYAALAAADLYVSPSYSEGFSMSVLEGMAAKLPCVITENCNFPEAQQAQAAYVVPTNSKAIGDALLTCLNNCKFSTEMSDRAQSFIFQNYTWEKSAHKLAEIYRDLSKTSC